MTTVLRRMPADLQPDDPAAVWWELVDIAAPPGTQPLGVALTRTRPDGVVRVLVLTPALPQLVRELVAALRRTDALAVELPASGPEILDGLHCEDVEPSGHHLLVRF